MAVPHEGVEWARGAVEILRLVPGGKYIVVAGVVVLFVGSLLRGGHKGDSWCDQGRRLWSPRGDSGACDFFPACTRWFAVDGPQSMNLTSNFLLEGARSWVRLLVSPTSRTRSWSHELRSSLPHAQNEKAPPGPAERRSEPQRRRPGALPHAQITSEENGSPLSSSKPRPTQNAGELCRFGHRLCQ
jgi:hypothetical protein